MAKPTLHKVTPAALPKPQVRFDLPISKSELHKGLDTILTSGDPMAQPIMDVIGTGLLKLKASSQQDRAAFASGLVKFLDYPLSTPEAPAPAGGPIKTPKPEPKLTMTLEQYRSLQEVTYALHELNGVLNHTCDMEEPVGSIVKILSDKLFATVEEIMEDEANGDMIRAANQDK